MHSDTSESGAQVTMDFSNAAFTQSHAQQTYITNTNANYPVCVCVSDNAGEVIHTPMPLSSRSIIYDTIQ